MNALQSFLRPWLHGRKLVIVAVLAGVVLGGAVSAGLLLSGGDDDARIASGPTGFDLSPQGSDVPRLTPVRVRFERAPAERDATRLLQIEPRPEGEYAWLDDRTVLFQPAYPGFLRGKEYQVTVPARPDAGLAKDVRASFVAEGPLTVEVVVPANGDAEVPAKAQVLVQFSRSVAPLTQLSEQRTAPVIEFNPPLPGKGEWLNTSLYRFVPTSVAPDTKYTAKIAAGLSSAADGVLEADYSWSFTTYGPALDGVSPDANSQFASLRQPITVYFNQPMDRVSVEGGFALVEAADETRVPGAIAWAPDGLSFTFTPSVTLKHLTAYTAVIAEGLKSARGTPAKLGRRVTFTTVGLPRVSSTQPNNGATAADRFGISIGTSNPMDVDSFEGKLSVSGFTTDEVNRSFYPEERRLYLSLPLRPSTAYTVTLAAGSKDRYGQVMGAYTFSFRTGELVPSLSFAIPGQVATYSASQEPVLYYHTTNRTEAGFTLYPLTPDEARYLQIRNYIPHSDKDPNENFVPSLAPRRTWTERIAVKSNEVQLNTTSLSGGGTLPKGDYYVVSAGTRGFNSELAFSVVDTAIVLKEASDELLAWVLDLDTGRPVAGAAVNADGPDVVGANQRTSDANGLVSFGLKPLQPFSARGQNSGVISVRSGGRYGAVTMNWRRGFDTFQLGLPSEGGFGGTASLRLVGHVYTDRTIYRPGETIEFKATLRRDDDAVYTVPLDDPSVDYVIVSSQGKALSTAHVKLNEFGTFAGSFTLPADADTGSYGIQLIWHVPTGTQRGAFDYPVAGYSFNVAEFRVPEFEVTQETAKPSYASGDAIAATTTASFFFGGQVVGAKVEWSVLSSPYQPRFTGLEKYRFGDFDTFFRVDPTTRNVVRDPVRAKGTAITGADGKAAFAVPAEIRGNEGPQQFTLSATVIDINGQAVAGSTTVAVHPGSVYAGVRTGQYVTSAGKDTPVSVVTVDTEGNRLGNRPVVVQVYERTWVTTKESTPDGARRYRSEPVDTLIQTLTATTDSRGDGEVAVRPARAGTLRIVAEATDERGRVARSSTYLWVSSGEFVGWYVSNDDGFKLVADRDQYEVGDTAQVLVPAPYAGSVGLITVERAKIQSATVQQFATNSTVISVPITARSVPNVFVSTVLYRPPTAEDPVPRYKVGYVELVVSTSTRVLDVKITPDRARARPGEKVHYDITVTDSTGKGVRAELAVAVVDKAVLSLAEERGPNGLKAFWFERGLSVATASSLAVSINRSNDVISEPRQGGKGGGGVDDERLRQDFKNTAYWNAQVLTGEDGKAGIDVVMPDNLTTWRTQVRAISGSTLVGEGTNELLSTQPLLLRPALPRFLRVGDRTDIRILVRNATAAAMDASVSIEASGIDLTDSKARAVRIESGESKLVAWPATASAEGTAKLTFRVTGAGLNDSVVQQLPVYLDVTGESTATGGVVKDRGRQEALFLPSYAILDKGSLEVSVQASLTGLLSAELRWFEPPAPPWDGSEGTYSIAARIIATSGIQRAADSGAGGSYSARLETDLARLVLRQRPDGGWSWCSTGCSESDPWVTEWVLVALGEAQKLGRKVDPGVAERAHGYASAFVNRTTDVKYPSDANEKALMLYGLATAGAREAAAPQLKALFEQYRAQLNTQGKAWLLLGLLEAKETRSSTAVQALLGDISGGVVPSANGNHWDSEKRDPNSYRFQFHTSAISTTATVLQALNRIDSKHPLIEETVRWLMVARSASSWSGGGTSTAQTLNALSEYAANTGEIAGNFRYTVSAGDQEILSGKLMGTNPVPDSRKLPLTTFEKGKVTLLTFLRDFSAKGRLYYSLNFRYVTPAQQIDALNRGFAISHEYSGINTPDVAITKAKVGDVIRVKVTVVASTDHNYVTVEDYLPAGLEPIDASLKTTDPALIAKLQGDRRALNQGPAVVKYYAPWYAWYYSPFTDTNIRDDRVVLRASNLPQGVHEYIYYVRATTTGDFYLAPAHVEETRFPEVFGRSDSGRFVVEP